MPRTKGEGAWKLVWSGADQRREQGVGLLMAPAWRDALLSFSQPKLLSVRFQAKVVQHLTMVTAYAPTDAGEDAAKDAFYLMLFAYLKGPPASDKLIVLGDFNVELGSAWR
jgi:exonuclease III